MKSKKKSILIVLLSMLMVATIAVSWVFWNSGIFGNDEDGRFSVTIGTPGAINTVVDISDPNITNLRLVPTGVRYDSTTETTSIVFTVDVEWRPFYNLDAQDMEGEIGILTAAWVDLHIAPTYTAVLDPNNLLAGDSFFENYQDTRRVVRGLEGDALFEVAFVFPEGTDITTDDSVPVQITITMNRPANREQMNRVINRQAIFTINFAVETADDLLITP
ncbi:MAG: hypothetical protein FWE03_01880 [Firmicutes bacterium]|nr:hypothetical protein [Bacillota bacterium]